MARKILLADDSVTAQNMGRKILADAGYEVITVNNGSAALKKIAETKPDLIVLDVYMPGYSGLEVCQRLKEGGDTSRIPILLTVGKLEPFKPEEARRARADGFIVKPFEASELLSALSKLEDKVVPRSESKPGRFARASAAIEENRFDRSTAPAEEDSGWKSRIVFPKKKEKPADSEEVDDQAIYNQVNKDLRTVVEQKQAEKAPAAQVEEEEKVDLGALAPAGLPKDVTPEEIAALAAAAAQMKGKLPEEKAGEPLAEMAVVKSAEMDAPKPEAGAEPVAEPVSEMPSAHAATFAEQQAPEKTAEKIQLEEKRSEPEIAPSPADVMAAIAKLEKDASPSPQPASSADDSWRGGKSEKSDEPVTMAVAAPAYSGPAVSRWTAVAVALAPEDGIISLENEMQKAFAASAGAHSVRSFTVAATPQLAPIPAPAAVVEPPVEAAAPVSSTQAPSTPDATRPGSSAAVENAASAASAPAEAAKEAVSEAAQTMNAVSSAAADAISAAVTELESVAAAYVAEKSAAAGPASTPEASPAAASSSSEQTGNTIEASSTEPPQVESRIVEQPRVEPSLAEQPVIERSSFERSITEHSITEHSIAEQKTVEATPAEAPARAEKPFEAKSEEVSAAPPKLSEPETTSEATVPAVAVSETTDQIRTEAEPNKIEAAKTEVSAAAQEEPAREQSTAKAVEEAAIVSGVSMVEASIAAAVEEREERSTNNSGEPARASGGFHAGGDEMAKRESETAAAWASWRKIRETGGPKPGQSESSSHESEESSPKDEAAMAVAAGAERAPEDGSLDADPEIASIVDSVLADMRPRIVEEIARKLGKKK